MAAGAKCKLRLFEPTDQFTKDHKDWWKILALGAGMTNQLHFYELEYAGAFSATSTEISAPNAVMDGTSVSVPLGIVSSDAADDVAGAAVRKVKVLKIDADGIPETEEYDMDGTTTVPFTDFPDRVMHMSASDWGSSKDAEGNITLARRGYQELATPATITGTEETGLTSDTVYYFKININGAGVVEYYITVTTTSCTFNALIDYLHAAKAVVGGATISGVTFSIVSGDLRCTSNSTLDTSSIAITAGTTGTDLLASLTDFSSMDTAVGSGYQELGLTGLTGASETGLTPMSEYFFKLNLNGAGIVEYYITTSTAVVTYTQLITLLNSARKESDDSLISGATFSLTGGDVRCTSDSVLDTASVSLTAGTTGTDLFGASGLNCTPDTAVGSGYQEIGLSGKTTGSATGLAPTTPYYFKIALDGGAATEYIVTTSTTPVTFNQLITALGSAVLQSDGVTPISGVTFSLVGGDLRATSDERGATSAVAITAGTSGTDLLGALTGYTAMDAAAYNAYQELGLTGRESENLTGLLASSQYYFKIAIDGAAAAEYNITTASDLSWTAILALMNTATTGDATWSLTGGDIRCTSDATDGSGSIALSAGTTGDDLFAQLTGFSDFDTAAYEGYQEFGFSGKTGTTATGLTTTKDYYFKLNIDGAGVSEYNITVTAGSTTFGDIITLLDAQTTGATWGITGGDLRCTSDATSASAAIALSVATLSGTSLFGSITGFSAFETAGGTGYQEFGLSGKTGTDATGLTATTTYYYKVAIDGAGAAEKNFAVIAGSTTFDDIMTALNASLTGATWAVTGGDLRLTSSTTAATSTITLSYASLSGESFIEGLTGFTALETPAGIGYQEFGLTGKTGTTETGLTAQNLYYFKIALNGAGAVEYHITITPTSDTTYAGVVALMNTAITAIAAEFSYPDGKLRCTSDSAASGSAIALTAGSTGFDLFASLTGYTAISSAVAYALYLTIAAGVNESDGAAIFVTDGWTASIREMDVMATDLAAASRGVLASAKRINFDGDSSDPDYNIDYVRAGNEGLPDRDEDLPFRVADDGAKITFSENYLAGAANGFFHVIVAVFDSSNSGRGIDTRS
jgi:hypothetical protein